ncbi:hypothetical protein [Lacticaseibacillus hegangensis]|uniref:Uncharacterized protein n=1 Tax=Lacticaseibacillus hegangensis TaxID=2486010 RepID=A0ABW4CV94_9LACO|nr:hypothetical protein [Lacticaseibacillus hegangensis]
MRKWWLALAVVTGLWWRGGQQVEAALPYQDLLFENVTWSPVVGQSGGIIYAPPSDLWVVAGTKLPVYFYRTSTSDFSKFGTSNVTVERVDTDENGQVMDREIKGYADGSLLVSATTLGTQKYRITTPNGLSNNPPFSMELRLHVIDRLPDNLHVNVDGLELFDFVPFQLFAMDDMGRKYLTQLFMSNEYWKSISDNGRSVAIKATQSPGPNTLQAVHIDYGSGLDYLTTGHLWPLIGRYTIVHKPGPIKVDQHGQAIVKLPVIIPPAQNVYVRLFWRGADGEEGALPIEGGVVQFKDLKPGNFPMMWRIEYKGSPFSSTGAETKGVDSYTYSNIQGSFISSQSLDLPTIPLSPLFAGTYTLSQISNGPISVAPTWQQLDITASGPWALQMSIKSPPALPMRLRLGNQETGTGEAAIQIIGADNQTVSLAESRLIIPKMPLLSPGEYTADITFKLIRGPTP